MHMRIMHQYLSSDLAGSTRELKQILSIFPGGGGSQGLFFPNAWRIFRIPHLLISLAITKCLIFTREPSKWRFEPYLQDKDRLEMTKCP